jgi:hypothetical protein
MERVTPAPSLPNSSATGFFDVLGQLMPTTTVNNGEGDDPLGVLG